jgi:hypothetical protein
MVIKPIEITPEWVLSELPQSHYADGNGNVSVDSDTISNAKWIELALNSLHIPYTQNEYGDAINLFIDFEFKLEDIHTGCPELYKKMKELDVKNKIYKNMSIN